MHKVLLKATDNGTRMGPGQWKSDKNGHVKLTKETVDFKKIKIKKKLSTIAGGNSGKLFTTMAQNN